ncbi:MAG TPA: hypothetical protein VM598_11675 [Bdellovibrionota bacterium]|nr:hypothetical protein [Bdellovibrionota bacterium]
MRSSRQGGPCVSIYFRKPHSRLSEQPPSIALAQELLYARTLLETRLPRRQAAEYLKPLLLVAQEELRKEREATFALFQSGEVSLCVPLPSGVAEGTVVSDTFHVKPLARAGRGELESGQTITGLFEIAQALRAGEVAELWVAEDVTLWGIVSRKRGTVVLHPRQLDARDGDILDDLFEWALDTGVSAQVRPLREIPGNQPAIARLKRKESSHETARERARIFRR